jgi:hypothetical protein
MWVLPPDVGPKYMPNIKDAFSFHNVGIGADVPSGRGTCKCDGVVSPDGSVMEAIDSGRALIVLNFARPRSYQYERKYA